MASPEMPRPLRAEIMDILQSLGGSWPHWCTLSYPKGKLTAPEPALVDPYIVAVQWLTDGGFITFEALTIDARGLTILLAGLTPKGRDYARVQRTQDVTGRSED